VTGNPLSYIHVGIRRREGENLALRRKLAVYE